MRGKMKQTIVRFLGLSTYLLSLGSLAQQLEFWDVSPLETRKSNGSQEHLLNTSLEPAGTRISIAGYNVENLFDTEHDEGKDDYARMPKSFKLANPAIMKQACETQSSPFYKKECYELDWSEAVLNKKIENIGRVIRAMNQGHGPDILVLEEVENLKVVTRLRDQALADLGYIHVVLIEGPDKRGIDVAMMSKFPVVDAQLHLVDLESDVPRPVALSLEDSLQPQWADTGDFFLQRAGKVTRGILEMTVRINNHELTVFGNHWPSQAGPTEQRARAAWTLYQAASQAFDRKRDVVALGDFNTLEEEQPNPLQQYLMNVRNPLQFLDAKDEFIRRYGRDRLGPGTHNYQGRWSFLDRFFVLKQSTGNRMETEWKNFAVHAPDFAMEDIKRREFKNKSNDLFPDLLGGTDIFPSGKVPMRFDPVSREGFSDHLGLVGTLLF
jgi:hypothetical protein